jgi:hypothetical protein
MVVLMVTYFSRDPKIASLPPTLAQMIEWNLMRFDRFI